MSSLFTFTLRLRRPIYTSTTNMPGDKRESLFLILLHLSPHAPYSTWPMGLSSSTPGAIRFVLGSPVALATEQRAIVGELHTMLADTRVIKCKIFSSHTSSR